MNRHDGQKPAESGTSAAERAAAVAAAAAATTEGRSDGNGRSSRGWIMLVLVLGVAAVALLVMERAAGPPSTLALPMLEGEPDIYMEAPVISQYRSDGTLEYRLEAAQAVHFQPDALIRLQEPRLTLYQPQTEPWSVSARRGSLQRPPGTAEETVVLEDDVTLRQPRAEGGTIRLMTPTLRLFPQRQYAETDDDVMIDGLFGRTTATGLKGDLQQGLLKLHSLGSAPVRTVLQPEQFK